MATHSSILAWKIPWTEEPDRLYSPKGRKEFNKTEQLTHTQKSNREFSQSDSTRVSGSQTEKDLSIPLPVHFFLFYF